MKDFTFYNPTKIIFGEDSMSRIGDKARLYGKKVLLTYGGGSIKTNGIYQKIKSELKDFEVKEFGGIEPNPRVETIRKAIKEYKEFNPDLILAVGGGSVIDGSKLLAAAMHYDGDPWDFLTNEDTEPVKYIPLATVLTLAATGSEFNNGAVITNWEKNEKLFFTKDELFPKFSILDPQNTFSLPKDQTAYGVIDAFSHVLEQYLQTTMNAPLQDRFNESILLTLIENAPIAIDKPDDYNARANIMLCATMALNGLTVSGTNEDWATHMIEHEISAFYDIPHAAGLAIITPRWMEVVGQEQKPRKLVQYGRQVWNLEGSDKEIMTQAIVRTYDFFLSLGVKMQLKDWQITNEHFDVIVNRLVKAKIGEFPLEEEKIKAILEKSL